MAETGSQPGGIKIHKYVTMWDQSIQNFIVLCTFLLVFTWSRCILQKHVGLADATILPWLCHCVKPIARNVRSGIKICVISY